MIFPGGGPCLVSAAAVWIQSEGFPRQACVVDFHSYFFLPRMVRYEREEVAQWFAAIPKAAA